MNSASLNTRPHDYSLPGCGLDLVCADVQDSILDSGSSLQSLVRPSTSAVCYKNTNCSQTRGPRSEIRASCSDRIHKVHLGLHLKLRPATRPEPIRPPLLHEDLMVFHVNTQNFFITRRVYVFKLYVSMTTSLWDVKTETSSCRRFRIVSETLC